jgi:hypothetical protein
MQMDSRARAMTDQLSGRRHNHTATMNITAGAPSRSHGDVTVNCRRTVLAVIASVARIFALRGTTPRSRHARI